MAIGSCHTCTHGVPGRRILVIHENRKIVMVTQEATPVLLSLALPVIPYSRS